MDHQDRVALLATYYDVSSAKVIAQNERIARIKRLINSGLSISQVANHLGLSYEYARQMALEARFKEDHTEIIEDQSLSLLKKLAEILDSKAYDDDLRHSENMKALRRLQKLQARLHNKKVDVESHKKALEKVALDLDRQLAPVDYEVQKLKTKMGLEVSIRNERLKELKNLLPRELSNLLSVFTVRGPKSECS